MNDTTHLAQRPEVAAFVARVRSRLGDLTEEEREELVGGLEADLAERLAEGETDLGDPIPYAAELRAAAGLEPRRRAWGGRRPSAPRPPLREQTTALLDGSRQHLDTLVADGRPAELWGFLVTLRPVWWFLRAWVAVQLIDMATGWEPRTVIPTLMGVWPGVLVTAVFTVVSVQIGRGRWWPGSHLTTSLLSRLVLLGLNLFAIVLTPWVFGQFPGLGGYDYSGEVYTTPAPGIQDRGSFVQNVFPYDAQGRPLTGVQLFDQAGRPLNVGREGRQEYLDDTRERVSYPWYNGGQRLWNVFPLPLREQSGVPGVHQRAWTSERPPTLPTAPLAVVPPAMLPTPSASPSASPAATPSASPAPDSEKPGAR